MVTSTKKNVYICDVNINFTYSKWEQDEEYLIKNKTRGVHDSTRKETPIMLDNSIRQGRLAKKRGTKRQTTQKGDDFSGKGPRWFADNSPGSHLGVERKKKRRVKEDIFFWSSLKTWSRQLWHSDYDENCMDTGQRQKKAVGGPVDTVKQIEFRTSLPEGRSESKANRLIRREKIGKRTNLRHRIIHCCYLCIYRNHYLHGKNQLI